MFADEMINYFALLLAPRKQKNNLWNEIISVGKVFFVTRFAENLWKSAPEKEEKKIKFMFNSTTKFVLHSFVLVFLLGFN